MIAVQSYSAVSDTVKLSQHLYYEDLKSVVFYNVMKLRGESLTVVITVC